MKFSVTIKKKGDLMDQRLKKGIYFFIFALPLIGQVNLIEARGEQRGQERERGHQHEENRNFDNRNGHHEQFHESNRRQDFNRHPDYHANQENIYIAPNQNSYPVYYPPNSNSYMNGQ
jgi:hypothetical protein